MLNLINSAWYPLLQLPHVGVLISPVAPMNHPAWLFVRREVFSAMIAGEPPTHALAAAPAISFSLADMLVCAHLLGILALSLISCVVVADFYELGETFVEAPYQSHGLDWE